MTAESALPHDLVRLRQAIALSEAARLAGELPFGALIVAADGSVLAEATSTEIGEGDWTCHAETNAVRRAAPVHPASRLAGATIYASAEPCVMCATAIRLAGIGRIVFGLSEPRLRRMLATRDDTPGLGLSCREVLAASGAAAEVLGPCLEEEAAAPHRLYWGLG